MHKHDRQHRCPEIQAPPGLLSRRADSRMRSGARRTSAGALYVMTTALMFTANAYAGSTVNAATAGSAGAAVSISNTVATKLLNANTTRYAWSVYCAGTAGAIAALMMPGDSAGDPASPAPSQSVGFPIPANTIVNSTDFPLRGLDAIHQRIDAEAQGAAAINCYTWEEQ
jgi:hypothetical protein